MASGLNPIFDLNGLTKLAKDVTALQEKAALVDQLQQENETLRGQLRQSPAGSNYLLEDNHLKQAKIDALEKQLKAAQSRIQKWRRLYELSSPSASDGIRSDDATSDDGPSNTNILRPSILPTVGPKTTTGITDREQALLSRIRKPLSETSPNPSKSPASRKRKADSHGADAIYTLAEDGEVYKAIKIEPQDAESDTAKRAAHRKVGDLLAAPSPTLPLLTPTPNISTKKKRPAVKSPLRASWFLPHKQPSNAPNTASRMFSFLPPKSRILAGAEDSEPFRSRPVHRQTLSNFKLNPDNNSGLDYAFSDVVRGRQERKCLPGCTGPCCGSAFKALAAGLDFERPDDDILKDFLGPKSEDKIRNLTQVARKNLLEEAKTKLAADLYGKHRHAHKRARSPPGFWRTDMPGTQEELEDREQSRLRERQEVESRYQDACRGDARWMFADE